LYVPNFAKAANALITGTALLGPAPERRVVN